MENILTIRPALWGGTVAVGMLLSAAGVAVAQQDALAEWAVERKGNLTVYKPRDLKPDEAFALLVEPPVNLAGEDLGDWVAARSENDAAKLGTLLSKNKPIVSNKNGMEFATCSLVYRPKNGSSSLMVAYTVIRRSDGTGRLARMLTTTRKETYSRYIPTATKAILTLAGQGKPTSRVASRPPSSSSGSGSGSVARRRPRGSDAYTRPGAGPRASEVYGVYSLMRMQGGVGGSFYMVHQPMVLLRDGTFFEDFDVPLTDFDVSAARAARPKAWGKWRKQGATFQALNSKGVWEKEEFYGPLPKAKPGERLKGFYSTISGGGDTALGGTTMVVVTSDITFLPDGRFKAGRFAGGMTPNVTVQSESGTDGTYTLDGYALTMKYRDGRVERRAFAFMDTDGTKDAFYSNGSPYLLKDKK